MDCPGTKVELQRYLGMIDFYHRYLPGVAAALAPLHSLVTTAATAKTKLVWSVSQLEAFEKSKRRLRASRAGSSRPKVVTVSDLSLIHI